MKNNFNEIYKYDFNLRKKYPNILGIDEVGRGCVAGSLFVVGLILKPEYFNNEIKDSKLIKSIVKRKQLAEEILNNTIHFKCIRIEPNKILNPKQDTKKAMLEIAVSLKSVYDIVLTDYEKIEDDSINQINIVKGDSTSFTIAAASIVAKHFKDNETLELNKIFPQYHFINHHGYLTQQHKKILEQLPLLENVYRYNYPIIKKILKK
ncbi:ribonuclease HII [Malacoplasma iowae]|uniref:Ribonuclease n=2 Tax=Malacoplasma iowae TaxID=2116 RepID=A0A084U4H9_MALIO|nr:ribonuclease HII [Malacoplasma iowae]VEU61549.1 ribonuclease HII [Mycoplasmopsis fermentans]EGZ30872.1 ribonuclease HII [Malacoplasma iowae 695]KFB07865.1 ribonuclease HII [Malacoplasma iowae DK-CPA]QHG89356.1 ribonuclease HII [Malacoplasma iowae 695]WPL35938.1 ribonuclease HII [Malacoplasma iowae]